MVSLSHTMRQRSCPCNEYSTTMLVCGVSILLWSECMSVLQDHITGKIMEEHEHLPLLLLRMHTPALCTLTWTNRRFVSPSIWVFQWDWRSISALEQVLHRGECARASIWRTGYWCQNCHKLAMLSPNARAPKERIFSTGVRQKKEKKGR